MILFENVSKAYKVHRDWKPVFNNLGSRIGCGGALGVCGAGDARFAWSPRSFSRKLSRFPMPLIFDQARCGQCRSAPKTHVDPGYVSAGCAGLTLLDLLLARRARSRVRG